MLESLQQMFSTALMDRITLLVNHVLASESEATKRLVAHAGRCIELQPVGWPRLMPRLPRLTFLVTPAGLVEWLPNGPLAVADLVVTVDASNPARLAAEGLTGRRPAITVSGDAQFAADVSWLMDNLRWDVEDDLARIVGDGPARGLARVARTVAAGVRKAASTVSGMAGRTGAAAGDASPR